MGLEEAHVIMCTAGYFNGLVGSAVTEKKNREWDSDGGDRNREG